MAKFIQSYIYLSHKSGTLLKNNYIIDYYFWGLQTSGVSQLMLTHSPPPQMLGISHIFEDIPDNLYQPHVFKHKPAHRAHA